LKRPSLRVLLSSGYTDHKSRWKKIKDRGFRFLQKPYDLIDLLRAIQEEVNS
jgi:DNA-binding NtrC family response regulator